MDNGITKNNFNYLGRFVSFSLELTSEEDEVMATKNAQAKEK
jgi:hypothetical protein